MLYGIISDIHSNLEALQAILGQLKKVDKIICLGDIVGYGPDPNACIKKIRELNIPSVAGNHEKATTEELDISHFNSNAKTAVFWTRENIEAENLVYMKQLPLILEEEGFQYVHGSLQFPLEEYIGSIQDAIPTFKRMTKALCFVGHTHRPLFIGLKKDGNYAGGGLRHEDELFVDDYEKVIINVGAVGQPRDRDPRASFGIYNSRTKIFSLQRVEYNIDKVQEKMRKASLPLSLVDRLRFGR